jgi:acyl-CoA dehydrogenase
LAVYTEEHEVFRRTFKRFTEKEMVPFVSEWEGKGEIPRSVWRRLGSQGYLCCWLDEKYGGAGAGFEYSMIINEELARAGIVVSVGLHSDIIAPYVYTYAKEEQKKRWLPGCASGEFILAIGMSEPGAGSDLQGIRTTAKREGNEYILNGQKTFISNGIIADLVVVACKTDVHAIPPYKGISLIVVEDGTPGFIKSRKLNKMGLHSQDVAELYFDNCRVPKNNLLGEEGMGFIYMMGKLQQERLVLTTYSQGLAEHMLADVIEYVKTREAFGQPICKFQHNAFKVAEMATEVEVGRAFLDSLVVDYIAGKDIVTRVSMAKWWIGEMANRIAYHCLQLYGGYGYMEEYPIARFYRDARAYTIYGGTTEIMKLIIARQLGL